VEEYDIIVVGADPSGCATALQLANRDPTLASRVLLMDKAVFPRAKLCAGGVTQEADAPLKQLGVQIDLPARPVHVSKFIFPQVVSHLNSRTIFALCAVISSMLFSFGQPVNVES
jgi:flavin-dependent dehydrogenase